MNLKSYDGVYGLPKIEKNFKITINKSVPSVLGEGIPMSFMSKLFLKV